MNGMQAKLAWTIMGVAAGGSAVAALAWSATRAVWDEVVAARSRARAPGAGRVRPEPPDPMEIPTFLRVEGDTPETLIERIVAGKEFTAEESQRIIDGILARTLGTRAFRAATGDTPGSLCLDPDSRMVMEEADLLAVAQGGVIEVWDEEGTFHYGNIDLPADHAAGSPVPMSEAGLVELAVAWWELGAAWGAREGDRKARLEIRSALNRAGRAS